MNKRRLFRDMRPDFQVELREVIPQILEACFYFAVFAICSNAFAVSPTIVSFTGGQVTPHLESRPDFQKYATASRTMENFLPAIQGPAVRRSGTRYVAEAAAADGETRPVVAGVTGISTPQELQDINNDPDGDYELLNDIDMVGFEDWTPLVLRGSLDGRYFTVSNLAIINETPTFDNIGFFFHVDGGTVRRIILDNFSILKGHGGTKNFGLMSGEATGGAVFTDCFVQGTYNGTVRFSFSSRIGAFIGNMDGDVTVTRCGAEIEMTAREGIIISGGFVVSASGTGTHTITDCYVIGTIDGDGDDGRMNSVGGFVGVATYTATQLLNVANCYCATQIKGREWLDPPVIGGFIGNFAAESTSDDDFSACFWDNDVGSVIENRVGDLLDCGKLDSTGDEGNLPADEVLKSNTTDMQTQSTFTDAGWDFDTVWQVDEGNDYPRHQWYITWNNRKPYQIANDNIRLIPFTVSTDDSYALEFGNQYIRFYRDSELD